MINPRSYSPWTKLSSMPLPKKDKKKKKKKNKANLEQRFQTYMNITSLLPFSSSFSIA